MKKQVVSILFALGAMVISFSANATSLMHVYRQALKHDPAFKIAYAKMMAAAEAEPKALSFLLPQINLTGAMIGWGWDRRKTDDFTGNGTGIRYKKTHHSQYTDLTLSLTQQIFDFTRWKALSGAKYSVKASKAAYNAALLDLIRRTSEAYFNQLQAKEVLKASEAAKKAFYQEYLRAKQSFKVGVQTITEVYQAKAKYDGAVADVIQSKNDLANREEELRAITGTLYVRLDPLKETIPLVIPAPRNINRWVLTARQQNWDLTAARYDVLAAHETIWAARGGHMPVISGTLSNEYQYINYSHNGTYDSHNKPKVELDIDLPIFSGGGVSSDVRKALAQYEQSVSTREEAYRRTELNTRKAYLAVDTGIGRVGALKQTLISDESALKGTREGFKVGTQTMIDVLLVQEQLLTDQKTYARARTDYINGIVDLKNSAGTLSAKDLKILNGWLVH